MAWVATAIIGGSVIGAGASMYAGSQAADASRDAADTSAAAQMEELRYLKEINALPQQYKESALTELNSRFNPDTGQYEFPQQQMVDQAQQSPLYAALMGSQQAGEESIMRNAGATGGLRSGNVQANMYDYNTQLQNQSLLTAYDQQVQQYDYGMQGLQGLAGLPTNEAQIGQTMAGIGDTQAQGILGAGQAQQQAIQGVSSAVGSGVGNYLWASGKGLI